MTGWTLAVAAGYVLWAVVELRRLVQLREQVAEAWSGVDVQLDRRSELVPKLVSAVRASQEHESVVLREVAELRRAQEDPATIATLSAAAQRLTASLHLIVRQESQPALQCAPASAALMHELTRIEDDLQGARMLFNQAVQRHNDRVLTLPSSLIARAMGLRLRHYFEVPDLRVD